MSPPPPNAILCKLTKAAKYVYLGHISSGSGENAICPGSRTLAWNGTSLHIGLSKEDGALVFVFASDVHQHSFQQGSGATMVSPHWLKKISDGSCVKVHSGFLKIFNHFESNALSASSGLCEEILMGSDPPRRVLCTGHGVGGALSTLCAAWCAIRFPTSDVRCITFGAPRLGNNNFIILFNVMVGITYCVMHRGDELFRAQHARPSQHVGSVLLIGDEKGAPIASISQSRRLYASAIFGEAAVRKGPNLERQPATFGIYGNQRCRFDDDVELSQQAFSSAVVLLFAGKVLNVVNLAGQAYRGEDVFSAETGVQKRKLVTCCFDTEVFVAWLESGTAIFAFRGTSSKRDVLQDLKISLTKLGFLQTAFPGARIHRGFDQQFTAAIERCSPNIYEVLLSLSEGRKPNRVICTGHSLGGALATIGAVWAAMTFPDADVRCITCGSPRVGNCKFRDAFKLVVGSSFRLVHSRDPVPFIPTPLFYRHVDNPFFLYKNTIRLGARPWYTLFVKARDHHWQHYRECVRNACAFCGLETTLARIQDSAGCRQRGLNEQMSGAMPIVSDS